MIWALGGALLTLLTAWAAGRVCLRGAPAPWPVLVATGAAVLSAAVFLLLLAGAANRYTLLALSALCGAGPLARSLARSRPPGRLMLAPWLKAARVGALPLHILGVIFGAYGVLYVAHALAPEVQPDAITYHLGLVAEYFRLGAFPGRVGFYEMVPQGMEMLFLHAYAFGGAAAAKLVHLALLVATVPLMVHAGRRLSLPDAVSFPAAALYFCAPAAGLTATSTYNDAALVFFTLAAFYALLLWRETRANTWLAAAGLAAGFCYAIKLPAGIVPVAGALFVLSSGGGRQVLVFAAAALPLPALWMARNAVVAGNPFAPLFNAWFPNPYFHASTERELAHMLANYGGVPLWRAPWELAVGGALQGTFGPMFLAAPLGLLALRRKAGRLCWAAAALLALPWFANAGARFLLPSLPFLWLAFAMALPGRALWAAAALQAVLCWPAVMDLYSAPYSWRLRGFPWRAAAGLEDEAKFLRRRLHEYPLARMLEENVPAGARVYSLTAVAKAYTTRDVLVYWHSAEAERLGDVLRVAGPWSREPLYDLRAEWPAQPLRGFRVRLPAAHSGELDIHELRLFSRGDRVMVSPQWTLTASAQPWELPWAFDDNLATRWRTWGPMRPGTYVQIDFDRPQVLTSAVVVSHTPVYRAPVEFEGLTPGGWRLLSGAPEALLREPRDLRLQAAWAVKRAGFGYILAPADESGNGPLGKMMSADPLGWGLQPVARAGPYWLFKIR